MSSASFLPQGFNSINSPRKNSRMPSEQLNIANDQSIIGLYGPWAVKNMPDPPLLSFRNPKWSDLKIWQEKAVEKTLELVSPPEIDSNQPRVTTKSKYNFDGLAIEELEWQLPYGRPTEAILLKPIGSSGRMPAVLGLHDHGGQKYFGKRKITRTSDQIHPTMVLHQEESYSGLAWANELAKRGYVVLVHDTFTFGSRRVLYKDIAGITYGACEVTDKNDSDPEDPENIKIYNQWAGEHEHIMSKSLFSSGTTWPGVTLTEDQMALDVLLSRPEVDVDNVGCCGLSGGGLRTDYLGGLDPRIKCAISVGFMTTWKDFILNKSFTHTWMTYASVLPKYLDFPEILGLRVPLPTMVLSDNDDDLYTLPEMKRADKMLAEIYKKGRSRRPL